MVVGQRVVLKLKGSRGRNTLLKCKFIKEYPNYFLMEHNGIKECFMKADFITKEIQVHKL